MRINFFVRYVLFLLVFIQAAGSVYGQEEKWTHYGTRPLAMGNAFVAVADDYNALFYNPAGLARLKDWSGELLNIHAELADSTRTFLSDIQALGDGSAGNTEAVLDLIESQTGKVQHAAVGMTPYLIFPNFGFAIGFEIASTMIFHRYPTIDLDVGPSVIIPVGFALNFLENRLSLGASVKARFEGGIDHEFSIQDIDALTAKKEDQTYEEGEEVEEQKTLKDYVQGGRAIGADFGLLFTPIKTMEPTLGISVTDIGGSTYEKMNFGGEAVDSPEIRLASVNTGFSIKPYQSESTYLLFAADAHSINQPYSFSKKLNFGSEFGLSRLLKIQLGLHQGYMSGGFQFDVKLLKLRFATYAEEMGSSAGTLADRRYALSFKLLI